MYEYFADLWPFHPKEKRHDTLAKRKQKCTWTKCDENWVLWDDMEYCEVMLSTLFSLLKIFLRRIPLSSNWLFVNFIGKRKNKNNEKYMEKRTEASISSFDKENDRFRFER